MNEEDAEFDRARQKSQGRFRSAFEAIFEKYGKLDEEDDIIDLLTEQIVVDNGRIRAASVIELGDLLHYPGSPTKSKSDRSRKRRLLSKETRGYGYARSSGSLSPELMSIEDIMKQQLEKKDYSADERDSDSETGSSELDLNFAPYTQLLNQRRRGVPQLSGDKYIGSEDESSALNYESSDSVGTEQETPIDMYFTSSIEQYLEKLRHQLLAPAPTSLPSYAEMDRYSEADNSSQISLSDYPTGQNRNVILSSYVIPSSPRTMSPRSPRRAAKSFENKPPRKHAHSENFYVSETSSQESDFGSDEESVTGSISSSESIIGPDITSDYGEYPVASMVGDASRSQFLYDSAEFEGSLAAASINKNYENQVDDDECSEEEFLDSAVYNSSGFPGQVIYSDFSPTFIHSTHDSSEYPSYQPASLPPRSRPSAFEKNPEQTNKQLHSHSSLYSSADFIVDDNRYAGPSNRNDFVHQSRHPSVTLTQPILFKPQPVSPHVFFDFDEPSSKKRKSYSGSSQDYTYVDSNVGIGAKMSSDASTGGCIGYCTHSSSRNGNKDNPHYQKWHF